MVGTTRLPLIVGLMWCALACTTRIPTASRNARSDAERRPDASVGSAPPNETVEAAEQAVAPLERIRRLLALSESQGTALLEELGTSHRGSAQSLDSLASVLSQEVTKLAVESDVKVWLEATPIERYHDLYVGEQFTHDGA